jgi:uncharacterized membrane protein YhfC
MDILYITYFLNSFLMLAMPLGLAIYLTRAWKLSWRFWLVGAATFILSQVGHIPFNYGAGLLINPTALTWPKTAQTIFSAVFLGLSASLFEEPARYAMFRWWLKDARSWRKGVLAGAGHGGAEAIIVGVLGFLTYINLVALHNPAVMATVPVAQAAAVQAQLNAAWSVPWYASLLGALERFLIIPVQITFSVIVLQTFIRKQGFWLWLAVLYHAIIDVMVVLAMPALGVYWTEAIVAGFCLLSLFFLFKLRQPEPEEPVTPEPAPVYPAEVSLEPVEETPGNLDNSKYQ